MKRRFRESADDTLFILSGAEVEVYEDSYEEGEGDYVNGYSVDIHGRYTLKELMKELSSWGFSDNPKDYMWWDENGYSELMTDVNLCEDGTKPSKSKLELWKNGEFQLYAHRLHGHLQMIKVRDLDYTDARGCGFALA